VPSVNIPDEHHILRYAKRRDLRTVVDTDENEIVIGLARDAFKLRDDETTLSVTWIEYFQGDFSEQKVGAVKAFRPTFTSSAKPPYPGAFGVGLVGDTKLAADSYGHKIRILHEPDNNPGHSAVHRIPRDHDDLFEKLATEVFADFFLNSEIS